MSDDNGETCPVGGPFGVCANGGACTPAPGAPFSVCITIAGDRPCSPPFPTKTSVSTGTPGFVDTRGCTACTCANDLLCLGIKSVDFHTDMNCGTLIFGVGATCTAINATVASESYQVRYATAGTASCSEGSGSSPTGGVALDPATLATVCCP